MQRLPASNQPRSSSRAWLIIPLAAAAFVIWADCGRARRVEYTSGFAQEAPKGDVNSPTGYADGARELIVPERNSDTYHWIAQTQQMFARGEWRVRQVDYDNAPFGRSVDSASPYRWWLGLVAWCEHTVSGRPLGQAVEWAALWADSLLHLLLLGGAAVFVARHFGALPAALVSLGLVGVFPFAAGFLPGVPDDHGLIQAGVLWSLLPLLAGIRAGQAVGSDAKKKVAASDAAGVGRRARRWFFIAGCTGGFGLWINVSSQVPVLAGIAVGALLAAWAARRPAKENPAVALEPTLWRAWALGGAITVFTAYLIEYFPAYLGSWQLRVIHPLYALAWLGGGELLVRAVGWIQRGKLRWGFRDILVVVLAIAAVAAVPVLMRKTGDAGFMAVDLSSFRLTKLPGSRVATSSWAWLLREGTMAKAWLVVWPLLLLVPAVWQILRRPAERTAVTLLLGPALVLLGFACWHLNWWSLLDGVLLVLVVATTVTVEGAGKNRFTRWSWAGFMALVLLPGAMLIVPRTDSSVDNVFNESEVLGLIERDLARSLAKHVGPQKAVVLAPPKATTTLYYYGGLHGLGTLSAENEDGITAAIRIASASTPEEAKELIERRGVTHIVMPSWDSYLDVYARIGMGQLEGTFLNRLLLWKLPPWLRPVPYQVPVIAGFEGHAVTIFEVVEDQEDATALSRIAEYFVEMGQLDRAALVGQALRRYPADLGAWVARAQVETARGDEAGLAASFKVLLPKLANGDDRELPWDRRVGLAIVLAQGKHRDQAREQVRRCLAEVDEAGLRSLTSGSLYRLQVLGKAYGLAMADQRLRELARDLLSADLRSHL